MEHLNQLSIDLTNYLALNVPRWFLVLSGKVGEDLCYLAGLTVLMIIWAWIDGALVSPRAREKSGSAGQSATGGQSCER